MKQNAAKQHFFEHGTKDDNLESRYQVVEPLILLIVGSHEEFHVQQFVENVRR